MNTSTCASATHQGDHLSLFIAGNDAAELEANSEDLRKNEDE